MRKARRGRQTKLEVASRGFSRGCPHMHMHMCGRHSSPYARKLSLDHDSGGENRGSDSVTHTSPSLRARPPRLVLTHPQFFEISKPQKSEHATLSGLSTSHQPVPQIMHWSKSESSKWSLDLYTTRHMDMGRPFSVRPTIKELGICKREAKALSQAKIQNRMAVGASLRRQSHQTRP